MGRTVLEIADDLNYSPDPLAVSCLRDGIDARHPLQVAQQLGGGVRVVLVCAQDPHRGRVPFVSLVLPEQVQFGPDPEVLEAVVGTADPFVDVRVGDDDVVDELVGPARSVRGEQLVGELLDEIAGEWFGSFDDVDRAEELLEFATVPLGHGIPLAGVFGAGILWGLGDDTGLEDVGCRERDATVVENVEHPIGVRVVGGSDHDHRHVSEDVTRDGPALGRIVGGGEVIVDGPGVLDDSALGVGGGVHGRQGEEFFDGAFLNVGAHELAVEVAQNEPGRGFAAHNGIPAIVQEFVEAVAELRVLLQITHGCE